MLCCCCYSCCCCCALPLRLCNVMHELIVHFISASCHRHAQHTHRTYIISTHRQFSISSLSLSHPLFVPSFEYIFSIVSPPPFHRLHTTHNTHTSSITCAYLVKTSREWRCALRDARVFRVWTGTGIASEKCVRALTRPRVRLR